MDQELLATCSSEVQRALRYIDNEIEESDELSTYSSPAFFALHHAGSSKPEEFISKFSLPSDPRTDIFEHMDRVVYLAKLYNLYGDGDWEQSEYMQFYKKNIKSRQMNSGDFSMTDYTSSGPIWFLSQENSSSESILRAIRYFLSEFSPEEEAKYPFLIETRALGVISLSELNEHRYREEIQEIGEWIAEKALEAINFNREADISSASYILMALLLTPDKEFSVTSELIQKLHSSQDKNGSWNDNLTDTGLAALALIHAGEGPKVPAIEAERELQREKQRREESKPTFLSTIPSTRSETRKTQILNTSENLIDRSDDILRISTLRIDLLYEEIIDKIEDDPSLKVRILTNSGNPSGPRSKLKKAAMNELVKRTDGNVKEDELIHSRMVISDQDELVVSSADLTREQLREEFNAGIYTQDDDTVSSAVDFFDVAWESAEHREVN